MRKPAWLSLLFVPLLLIGACRLQTAPDDSDTTDGPRNVPPPADSLSIMPATVALRPAETVTFMASGGSGEGYLFSLAVNRSGGSIDAQTGLYTAGPTAPAVDQVEVRDSAGESTAARAEVDNTWVTTLEYTPAPPDNPLKGFMRYWDDEPSPSRNFPHSMEYFYIPLNEVQTDYESFDWRSFEERLDAAAARGHHCVMRFYIDYPDHPYGMPDFLSHVARHAYTNYNNGHRNTSYSPNYEDPDLRRAMRSLIADFGSRYDGDPRIGFIEVGLIGHWGEWHTAANPGWMASRTVMDEVLDSYQTGFQSTQLLLREPKTGVDTDRPHLGFHDDSFAYNTIGSQDWYFWSVINEAGLEDVWRRAPIGGEVRPEIQSCIWDQPSCTPTGQDFTTCVDVTHASWLLHEDLFEGLQGAARERALAGARRLGYEFSVQRVEITPAALEGQLQVAVEVTNSGRAPFYYPWAVELGVIAAGDPSGAPVVAATPWDLTSLMPGEGPVSWRIQLGRLGLAPGDYRLLLRVVDPLASGKKLRFANVSQDADRAGWLTLGRFSMPAGISD